MDQLLINSRSIRALEGRYAASRKQLYETCPSKKRLTFYEQRHYTCDVLHFPTQPDMENSNSQICNGLSESFLCSISHPQSGANTFISMKIWHDVWLLYLNFSVVLPYWNESYDRTLKGLKQPMIAYQQESISTLIIICNKMALLLLLKEINTF